MEETRAFLTIPDKIIVGYNKREDTFSGRLAFVTYMNGNKISKEASWTRWRDKSIPSDEFANVPSTGFVINKSVGGYNYGYFRKRGEWIRIYDPRGFEIELSIGNLIYIIQECEIDHGELPGEFVYSWDGPDLVLLPVGSSDYNATKKMEADREAAAVSWKTMEIGRKYALKNWGGCNSLYYIGRRKLKLKESWRGEKIKTVQYHLFWDKDNNSIKQEDNIKNILYPVPEERKLEEHEIDSVILALNSLPCSRVDDKLEEFVIPEDKHAKAEFERIFKNRKFNNSVFRDSIKVARLRNDGKTLNVGTYFIDSKGSINDYGQYELIINPDGSITTNYPHSSYSSLSESEIQKIIDTTTPIDKIIGYKIGDTIFYDEFGDPPYPMSRFDNINLSKK